MADNRLTKKRLKNHFAYNWWKYALSAAVSAMLVSIVFAVTAYRPPAEKKVELYVLNGYIDTETFQRDFWPELQARKPEQEELTVLNINLTDSSNIYAPMQFSTYVAAQQGDLFLISRDEMRRITADGAQEALVELTGYLDSGVIDADGMDLKNGTLDRGDGTTAVYAIPADTLTGLSRYGNDPKNSLLCIPIYTKNADSAAALIGLMLEKLRSPSVTPAATFGISSGFRHRRQQIRCPSRGRNACDFEYYAIRWLHPWQLAEEVEQ